MASAGQDARRPTGGMTPPVFVSGATPKQALAVLAKVVRDREESRNLVNEVRQARYEEILANAPAPGLGHM